MMTYVGRKKLVYFEGIKYITALIMLNIQNAAFPWKAQQTLYQVSTPEAPSALTSTSITISFPVPSSTGQCF